MYKTFGFSSLQKKKADWEDPETLPGNGGCGHRSNCAGPILPPASPLLPYTHTAFKLGILCWYQVGLLSSRRALSHMNSFSKASRRHGNNKTIGTASDSPFKMLSIDTKQGLFTRCRTKLFISVIFMIECWKNSSKRQITHARVTI